MRIISRILILFVILAAVILASAFFYLNRYGKDLLLSALQNAMDRPVSVGAMRYQPPFGLHAEDVQIEGLLNASSLDVQWQPQALLQKELRFSHVRFDQPQVVIEKISQVVTPQQNENLSADAVKVPNAEDQKKAKSSLRVQIDRLIVKGGKIQYSFASSEKERSFVLEDANLIADQLVFPLESQRTEFQLKGMLLSEDIPFSGNHVVGKGWIDIVKKDMESQLKIFQPDGNLALDVNLVSQNNDMTVKGNFQLGQSTKGSVSGPVKDPEQGAAALQALFKTLGSIGVQIGGQFSFQTKMDDFHVNSISFSGDVVQ